MNFEKDKAFEAELRKLSPRPPGPELEERLERSMGKMENRRRVLKLRVFSGWAGLAVAASILIVFGLSLFRLEMNPDDNADPLAVGTVSGDGSEPPLGDDLFKPVLAQNNLRERVDEGIVFLRNGITARKYRYEFIDRVVWRNPADGAIVQMEIPRDEVILIPVQTF
ncbi:MAG: hypothetical protein ACO3ZW_03285 [Opitutales bacterium]|jgi:hypothetical protein